MPSSVMWIEQLNYSTCLLTFATILPSLYCIILHEYKEEMYMCRWWLKQLKFELYLAYFLLSPSLGQGIAVTHD